MRALCGLQVQALRVKLSAPLAGGELPPQLATTTPSVAAEVVDAAALDAEEGGVEGETPTYSLEKQGLTALPEDVVAAARTFPAVNLSCNKLTAFAPSISALAESMT